MGRLSRDADEANLSGRRTGDQDELKRRASEREDATSEESGKDRKNRSWQKGE